MEEYIKNIQLLTKVNKVFEFFIMKNLEDNRTDSEENSQFTLFFQLKENSVIKTSQKFL